MGGGHHAERERVPPDSESCKKHQVPPEWRDYCSHKLIPLNICRYKEFFLPWKCVKERHAYEACQYDEFLHRVNKLKEMKK